jgi:hypothetical protein
LSQLIKKAVHRNADQIISLMIRNEAQQEDRFDMLRDMMQLALPFLSLADVNLAFRLREFSLVAVAGVANVESPRQNEQPLAVLTKPGNIWPVPIRRTECSV